MILKAGPLKICFVHTIAAIDDLVASVYQYTYSVYCVNNNYM